MNETTSTAKKFPDKAAVQAKHDFERASATGEEASRRIEDTYSKAAEDAMEYHRKALAVAQANINMAFECAQELLGVTSPSEFVEVAAKRARQQVQAVTEQTRELSALAQKAVANSIQPLTGGLTRGFRGTT